MRASAGRRIITISYDFRGDAIHDPQLMEGKISRHPDWSGATFLSIVWSRKRETFNVLPYLTLESLPMFVGAFRPFYDLLSVFAAPYIAWRRRERPESIVVYEFPLLWAAFATHLFVGGAVELRLTTLPTELAATFGTFHRYYYRFHELLAWRLADRFVVINEITRNYVMRLGVPAERIRTQAPDTIARDEALIARAKRGAVRARYNIPAGMPIVLSVGRFEIEKAYLELLEVFAASHVEAKLVIVGDGSMRAVLGKKAGELGIAERVIFAGRQDRAHIWDFYADADVFVLLSHSESLGMVFWEAMYMRVPVIGRPVGGIKETIGQDGERGFFWDTADGPDTFEDKLIRAIQKDDEVKKMIERAEEYVKMKIIAPVLE